MNNEVALVLVFKLKQVKPNRHLHVTWCKVNHVFNTFFTETGTNLESILSKFSAAGYAVTVVCGVAVLILAWYLLQRFAIYNKVRTMVRFTIDGGVFKDLEVIELAG